MAGLPGDGATADALAIRMAAHVETLCRLQPDRSPGSPGNREAVAYIERTFRALGLETESIPFETVGWRAGRASLEVGGERLTAHPEPYSPAFSGFGRLVPAASLDEIKSAEARGAVLLLHGPAAASQLTPRAYPWYSNPAHDAILDALDAAAPACVIAATGKDPASTAGLSPFPLIEDAAFDIPSAYLSEDLAPRMLGHVGETVRVRIDSERFTTECAQPIGHFRGSQDARRVLVTSHLDTKHDTPGALDNASGVAVMLGVAKLLGGERCSLAVEFVPFNGEDHFASPGEVAYLDTHPNTDDVLLVINIDGAGFAGRPTALSRFETAGPIDAVVDAALAAHTPIVDGEPWFSGDHAIFVMRGVPALALTSRDMLSLWSEIPHTPADTPDRLDFELLAETARFIAEVILKLDRVRHA